MKSFDISSEFTPEGIQKLNKGTLLRFKDGETINELIITYINKNTHKVRARQTKTYTENELRELHEENHE